MNISELVAQTIVELLDKAGGSAEIQRKELAEMIGCVPSQINYVLTSRFTPERGYTVESRRGGGGYIRIRRVNITTGSAAIMHIVNCIGGSLDEATARILIKDMAAQNIISSVCTRLMLAATSEGTLRDCPAENREQIRAAIFKQMLINAV